MEGFLQAEWAQPVVWRAVGRRPFEMVPPFFVRIGLPERVLAGKSNCDFARFVRRRDSEVDGLACVVQIRQKECSKCTDSSQLIELRVINSV